jgi:drug/metabolite transporter (DMT)-like permease
MFAVSVPFCYAISNILVQKSLRDISPVITVFIFMAVAATALTPLAFLFETITIDENFTSAIGAIVLLSIFARGIAMLLFYKLIQRKGPLFAGMVTYVIPTEALMWSWFDDEHISLTQITAIVIVLLVVVIVQRDIVRRSQISSPKA